MKKEAIKLSDIKRILIGEAPFEFLLEVLLRTGIIYCVLLLTVRLLGKRMSGQLTITELAVMILMGAIVSAPMELPERGIMQGFAILILILLLHQGVTWLEVKFKKVELVTQGIPKMLVADGVIQTAVLAHVQISKDQLFAVLRGQAIYNLGKVKRVYLETCGKFTIYKFKASKAGLSVLPPEEGRDNTMQQVKEGNESCSVCGYTREVKEAVASCPNCFNNSWEWAIL
ncbi:YetF domain-containing protein [Filimonas effusa]|uniref:DUF421 domain-containing protein n=1 Tax=Filimonas effusa TaxID=2508721 RepID=A0A4Q1DAZ8_9BACT|nr:YetF domain-containing protein [Filimonas effusa]RXK86450.1 DUF421 domain-containing protein [Filimonas effusa]